MIDSFMRMYRIIRDINNMLSVKNFKSVEVRKEFFKDLEKVFEEIADVLSYPPLFESTKKDNV